MFGFKRSKEPTLTDEEKLARIQAKALRNNTEIGISVFPHAPEFTNDIGVVELDVKPPTSAELWEKSLFGRDVAQNKRGDRK